MSAESPDDLSGWPTSIEVYQGMPDSTMLRVPLGMLRELAARPSPAQSAMAAGSAGAVALRLERILAVRSGGQRP